MDDVMTTGPVGMAATPIGMLFLYEMGAGDVTEFARQPYEAAIDRVRWLLTRVASKASAGMGGERPAMLGRAEVASLGDDDVQSIVEVFLSSPENEWQAHRAADAGAMPPRADDEGAVQYLDRLVQWRASLPLHETARRPQAPATAFPSLASTPLETPFPVATPRADPPMSRVLTWVSAGLALTVLLSVAALAFAAMSYFEARSDQEANALWRAEMRRMQEAKPAPVVATGAEKLVSELSAENARLRYRLQLVEEKAKATQRAGTTASEKKSAAKPKTGRQVRER